MKTLLFIRRFSSRPMPAIASDIDGVIQRGGREIGNSQRVLRAILNNKVDGKYIPLALLTNGGGMLESERAELINNITGLSSNDKNERKLEEEHMILCHTPFKAQ